MRALAAFCLILALACGVGGLALGAYGADKSANNSALLRTLLLDGKTASAISAKKTAKEVELLSQQQEFDHQQAVQGTKTLARVESQVEKHLDRTIRRAIGNAARTVTREIRHAKAH